ncbi:MAG TPA: hypothetical protein VHG91_05215 [Longimicrobium sp.]|nr:hypothetical protein [Longimicrobium sp.]
MKNATFAALAAAALTLGAAATAEAQVLTPTFQSPRTGGDIGVYVNDGPGDLSIEGILRTRRAGYDLGFHVGFADFAEDGSLMLGLDYRNPLSLAGTEPLAIAFTAGAQAFVGDAEAFGAQAGLSIGYTFASPGVSFTPYIHPRIAVINGFAENDDLDLEPLADVGVDVDLSPRISLRFGANLGEGADWGIGLAWRR